MAQKINPKKLSGLDLYYYYTIDHPDEDYRSVIQMLPIAAGSMEVAIYYLERATKGNRKICVCYPPSETVPDGAEIIGSVPDGVMYLL